MKHKHADLIHAWADGAEIQFFSRDKKDWVYTPEPTWQVDTEYRVKPTVKFSEVIVARVNGHYSIDINPPLNTLLYSAPPSATTAARQIYDAAVSICWNNSRRQDGNDDEYARGYRDGVYDCQHKIVALPIPGETK